MAENPFDATQYYEVKKGDTLWKIAEKFYGDGKLAGKKYLRRIPAS